MGAGGQAGARWCSERPCGIFPWVVTGSDLSFTAGVLQAQSLLLRLLPNGRRMVIRFRHASSFINFYGCETQNSTDFQVQGMTAGHLPVITETLLKVPEMRLVVNDCPVGVYG